MNSGEQRWPYYLSHAFLKVPLLISNNAPSAVPGAAVTPVIAVGVGGSISVDYEVTLSKISCLLREILTSQTKPV